MNLSYTTIKWRFDQLFPPGRGANDTINREVQVQPSTVDLRLGNVFYVMADEEITKTRVNPRTYEAKHFFRRVEVPKGEPFVVKPGAVGFVLGETMEYVSIPPDLVGFVDGRSSYGRWGLQIHSTAGLIDAGFHGIITLEISLNSVYELEIYPGDRICQIRFEMLDQVCRRPYGHESRHSKYQDQDGVAPSRSNLDEEAR